MKEMPLGAEEPAVVERTGQAVVSSRSEEHPLADPLPALPR